LKILHNKVTITYTKKAMSILERLPKPFFILAPMDDVTDTVFRQIIADIAKPDIFFTEFVNVDGLQSPGRPKLIHKLKLSEKEHPIIAQLWGLKTDNYYKTTKDLIKMGYDGVDINMGCPVKTVVKNGACAALINNKELAGDIIDAVKDAAGDKIPVSVKTRVGFNDVDLSWPEFLLSKDLNMLSMHGRTAKQMSKVPANWDLICEVKKLRDNLSPATLIVGNGDVINYQHGKELAEKYKLDGVMIGRGIFDDPYAFSENSPWQNYTREQKIGLYRKHVELFINTWKNNERKIETLNKFCKVYINGFDGAKEYREKLMHAKSADELLGLLS
jgi:tRNA-dihydrouridine synthase